MILNGLKFCSFNWNLLSFSFIFAPLVLTSSLSFHRPRVKGISCSSLIAVHQHQISFQVPSVWGLCWLSLSCYLISATILNFTDSYLLASLFSFFSPANLSLLPSQFYLLKESSGLLLSCFKTPFSHYLKNSSQVLKPRTARSRPTAMWC